MGGVWDSSEKAFNMITAGTDTGKERRRGVAGEEERGWQRPANIDKYFIPQHTESLRLVPRGREGRMEGGEREREREREKRAETEGKAKRQKSKRGREGWRKKGEKTKGGRERDGTAERQS